MLPIKSGESGTLLQMFKFNTHKESISMLKIVPGIMFCISMPFQNTGRYSMGAEFKDTTIRSATAAT
jgi:hypothetical protein